MRSKEGRVENDIAGGCLLTLRASLLGTKICKLWSFLLSTTYNTFKTLRIGDLICTDLQIYVIIDCQSRIVFRYVLI